MESFNEILRDMLDVIMLKSNKLGSYIKRGGNIDSFALRSYIISIKDSLNSANLFLNNELDELEEKLINNG